jgi:hypothetical protein
MGTLQDLIDVAGGQMGASGLLQKTVQPGSVLPKRQAAPPASGPTAPAPATAPRPGSTRPFNLSQLASVPRPRKQWGSGGTGAGHFQGDGHNHGSAKGSGSIVNVGGIMVDKSIADRVSRLLAHAGREGIRLSGGGYRSPEAQADLYRRWRAGTYRVPAVARPGHSRHERGVAIDFSGIRRGTPAFQWLQRNAGTYGFYNLPSEPWHWSVDGH